MREKLGILGEQVNAESESKGSLRQFADDAEASEREDEDIFSHY